MTKVNDFINKLGLFSGLVFTVLLLITIILVWQGPVSSYLSGETEFMEDYKPILKVDKAFIKFQNFKIQNLLLEKLSNETCFFYF